MTNCNIAPEISFRVEVDINVEPPKYTFYNDAGTVCDGSTDVSVPHTAVIYRLINNSDDLVFAAPLIEAKEPDDLTILISNNQQTLTVYDSDMTNETVCMKLVTTKLSHPTKNYISPDPQIRNIPPQ